MEYQQTIEDRYSVRKFDEKIEVTKEQIMSVLEAGRLAPTAKNKQSQRIYVVADEANLKKVDLATRCRYGARCCLVIGFSADASIPHSDFSPDDTWEFGDQDAVSVLVHMMLKVTELGLGSCWVGAFDTNTIKRELDLPQDFMVRAMLMIGMPAEDAEPSERHTDRKPLEETVTWVKVPE